VTNKNRTSSVRDLTG